MKTAWKLLLGLALVWAVAGCRCCGDGLCDNYWTRPCETAACTPPQVTMP